MFRGIMISTRFISAVLVRSGGHHKALQTGRLRHQNWCQHGVVWPARRPEDNCLLAVFSNGVCGGEQNEGDREMGVDFLFFCSYKATILRDQGCIFMTLFKLNYLLKGPIFRYSHLSG